LARLDRKRKKRMSNKEWASPADGDARITKMKDGRTHLAHKAEHAVDGYSCGGGGDAASGRPGRHRAGGCDAERGGNGGGGVSETRSSGAETGGYAQGQRAGIEEMVADKGYYSGAVLERVKSYEVRTYIPEKK
jgi:transposase